LGLIKDNDTEDEIVFHSTALVAGSLEQLREGQSVELDPREEGRSRTISVRLA